MQDEYSLPIVQNFDFYAQNKIATELNEKNNKIFKLGSLCKANGFEIKELHKSRGDTEGMMKLMAFLKEKDPALFRQSLSFTNKNDVLNKIKETDYFFVTLESFMEGQGNLLRAISANILFIKATI